MQSQQSIILYKVTHDLSTSSPEEDEKYAVKTSRSTSSVTNYTVRQTRNLVIIVIYHDE